MYRVRCTVHISPSAPMLSTHIWYSMVAQAIMTLFCPTIPPPIPCHQHRLHPSTNAQAFRKKSEKPFGRPANRPTQAPRPEDPYRDPLNQPDFFLWGNDNNESPPSRPQQQQQDARGNGETAEMGGSRPQLGEPLGLARRAEKIAAASAAAAVAGGGGTS